MTRTMIFAAGFAVAGAIAASTVAFAQEQNTIDEVEVKADLGDVNKSNALDYWPSIEEDLEAAIKASAGPLVSNEGYDVTVQLKEISLSGSKLLSDSGEFNRIDGWVYFRPEEGGAAENQHNIIIDAKTGDVPTGAIAVIVPGKPEFYNAMLVGFADATLNRLEALDGPMTSDNDESRPSQ